MKILGISEGHNCTAAVMIDGEVIACVSEERFSRKKNDAGYPQKAINYCLQHAKIKPEDLDVVAFSSTDLRLWWNGIRNEALFSVDDHIYEQYEYYKKGLIEGKDEKEVMPEYIKKVIERKGDSNKYYNLSGYELKDLLNTEINQKIRKETAINHLNVSEDKIKFLDHHDCHAAFAYYSSPYRDDKVLVATMDSSGDRGINTTLSIADEKGINKIFETTNNQWGRIYKYITLNLGMKVHEHEYKVMGMAPYANIKEVEKSYKVFDDILKINDLEFEWINKPRDLYFHFRDGLEGHRFDGIAGALQKKLEESISEWLDNAIKKTGIKKVVFGGGLAMNIKMNLSLSELENVEKIFIGPSPADESNSIGACYFAHYQHCQEAGKKHNNIPALKNAYLGPEFNHQGFLSLIENDKSGKYKIMPNIKDDDVAKLLAEGKIITRCIGRMEFGARALGNRSILANPSKLDTVKKINKQIKHRDFWMPFACSIMEDQADRYLVSEKDNIADYMTLGFKSKEIAHTHLLAALHPDDLTARPQIVRREQNPGYYSLLNEFYKITDIGGVLNTSLNLHGHPIVCSPEDLLMVLENSDLEYVYVKDHLIYKGNI
jgi:carbamoyltransferase